jgi:group I intron endonuclease
MTMGIYSITNLKNKKCYIGSSVNIEGRWRRHKTNLNTNEHHCKHLQRAWNKYGKFEFSFNILKIVKNSKMLIKIEQSYLNNNKNNLYNSCKKAYSCLGIKRTKKQITQMTKCNIGEKSHFAKLKEYQIKEIKEKLLNNYNVKELSEYYKVSPPTIYNIRNGATWNNLGKINIPKGAAYGEKQHCAKLKNKDIANIRKMFLKNISNLVISKKYKVSRRTIADIKNNVTWKKV